MEYKDYIQSIEVDGVKIFEDVYVTEDVNYNKNTDGDNIIITYQVGTITDGTMTIPIQWKITTNDISAMRSKINSFIEVYNTEKSVQTDGTYFQEFYNTPILGSTFSRIGNNYSNEIILPGFIMISKDVSDIKTVTINGFEVETLTRTLTYTATVQSVKNQNEFLNTTDVIRGGVQLTITIINKQNNYMSTILKAIRLGERAVTDRFEIKLTYVSGEVETHSMVLLSANLNSDNQKLPLMPISFMK